MGLNWIQHLPLPKKQKFTLVRHTCWCLDLDIIIFQSERNNLMYLINDPTCPVLLQQHRQSSDHGGRQHFSALPRPPCCKPHCLIITLVLKWSYSTLIRLALKFGFWSPPPLFLPLLLDHHLHLNNFLLHFIFNSNTSNHHIWRLGKNAFLFRVSETNYSVAAQQITPRRPALKGATWEWLI